MPHNDAHEWGREGGFIANDVLKAKKVIDFKVYELSFTTNSFSIPATTHLCR